MSNISRAFVSVLNVTNAEVAGLALVEFPAVKGKRACTRTEIVFFSVPSPWAALQTCNCERVLCFWNGSFFHLLSVPHSSPHTEKRTFPRNRGNGKIKIFRFLWERDVETLLQV